MRSARSQLDRRADELAVVLGQLRELSESLSQTIREGHDAMRRADVERMRSTGAAAQRLTEQLSRRDGLRKQLMEAIGAEVGWDARRSRAATLNDLAGELSEPGRSRVLALGAALKTRFNKLQWSNRSGMLAAREMLEHFKHVAEIAAEFGEQQGTYSRSGQRTGAPAGPVFEAVV